VLQVHRPEICYPVGGFVLSPTRSSSVRLAGRQVPANMFSAVGPDRTEQVLYWTRVGTTFPRSWAEQRYAVARANVGGRIPDGAMLRISLIGGDLDPAQPLLEGFARDFVAASPQPLNHVLLGPTG
jgi:EpsI family protein